jgi:hypothetical protein
MKLKMLNIKIIGILVCMFLLSISAGALSSANISMKLLNKESANMAYSHNILGESFTMTTCVPCKYSHSALKNVYKGEYHPFYYISMVYVKNKWAQQRYGELSIEASPTVAWDGGYKKDQGSTENIEEDMARYNTSIIGCGNRNVKDIDLSLNVEWPGTVNNVPEDGETGVPIQQMMSWTISQMEIDVEVTSNEASQYNGHLHVYVTEVNSTLWEDQWGDPYTFAFLDYAWNEDVTFSGAGSWDDTVIWDGYDHHTGYYEYYQNITQDNIMVIASIFDEDNDDYVDETTGFVAGIDTDPKLFDIYFGDTNPPPKVHENVSFMQYSPQDPLNFNTKYYWKIDVWDNQSTLIPGQIWSFTTIENELPLPPIIFEENEALFVYTLDPDHDDVFYLVDWDDGSSSDWLGPYPYGEIVEISHEWTEPGTYEIKAKARDIHDGESDWSDPDPDGDDIAEYIVNWGDDTGDETLIGPFPSGSPVTASHTWSEQGTYSIKVKAKDIFQHESDWGTLEVTMPRDKFLQYSFILKLLQKFPNTFPILRNILRLQ